MNKHTPRARIRGTAQPAGAKIALRALTNQFGKSLAREKLGKLAPHSTNERKAS